MKNLPFPSKHPCAFFRFPIQWPRKSAEKGDAAPGWTHALHVAPAFLSHRERKTGETALPKAGHGPHRHGEKP